jgi:hypothetical protein
MQKFMLEQTRAGRGCRSKVAAASPRPKVPA